MIIMDFNGITWVGNIYQKLEAMCLEVEEVVCEDTVKFVENQAQTVSASVKKFYSDVIEDLLPPSCMKPDKLDSADLYLIPYADSVIYKKPKISKKKETTKIDEVTEDSKVIAEANADYKPSLSGLYNVDCFQPPYSMGPVRGTGLELCLEQNEHRGVYKRKSRRGNHLPSEISGSITPMANDLSQVSSCRKISESHGKYEVGRDRSDMISCPAGIDVTGCDSSGSKSCKNIDGTSTVFTADASIDTLKSDMSLPVKSGVDAEVKLRFTSSDSGPDVLAAEPNGTYINRGMISVIGSHINGITEYNESISEDRLSAKGDSSLGVIEDDDGTIEPGMEIINEQVDNSKLEETCVLVDRENFCPEAHRKDKPRSYKKKIQKAFSSKRSSRRHEYEQLAVQHGDMDMVSDQEGADTEAKKSPPHGVCESEWELL